MRGYGQKFKIVAKRFLVTLDGFIYEKRTGGVDDSMKVAKSVGVEKDGNQCCRKQGGGQWRAVFLPRANPPCAVELLLILQREYQQRAQPSDDADRETFFGREHESDKQTRNSKAWCTDE